MKKLLFIFIFSSFCLSFSLKAQTDISKVNTSGYMGIVEASFGLALEDWKDANRLSITMINGYKFNPYFYLGVGVGFTYYTSVDEVSIPIYAYLKANFSDTRISPFLSASVGYNIATQDNSCFKGLLLEPSLGVDFSVGNKNKLSFGIGFAMYNAEYLTISSGGNYFPSIGKDNELAKAINFKLGFSF